MKKFLVSRFSVSKTCLSLVLDLALLLCVCGVISCDQSLLDAVWRLDLLEPVLQLGFWVGIFVWPFCDVFVCLFVFLYEGLVFIARKIVRKESADKVDPAE